MQSSSPNGKRERVVVVPSSFADSALDAYVRLEQHVRERDRELAKEGRSSSWTVTFTPVGFDAARVVSPTHKRSASPPVAPGVAAVTRAAPKS